MGNTVLPRIGDGQMQRLIGLIEQALNDLEGGTITAAIVLTNVPVTTSGGRVYHGLGRAARGAWVVRATQDVRIALSLTPDAVDPSNWFFVNATVATTLDLAVY